MRFDFPTLIVLLVLATGLIWAFDALVLSRRRSLALRARQAGGEEALAPAAPSRIVEYSRSFFPVLLIVLLLRSFVVEPFRIPSNSMMPTLLTGDFILVSKYSYGIRLPVVDSMVLPTGTPERGDVVVFRYPEDMKTPFIKRIVGLPGDEIDYRDKILHINGEAMEQGPAVRYTGYGSGAVMDGTSLIQEKVFDRRHPILIRPGAPSRETRGVVVPKGHYFVLGDNRDHSRDSRFWGMVPDEMLIGRAFGIWMNWDFGHGIEWSRIGQSIH